MLKVFTTYNIQLGDAEILRVMALARAGGALVCVHAENDAIIAHARASLLAAGIAIRATMPAPDPAWLKSRRSSVSAALPNTSISR